MGQIGTRFTESQDLVIKESVIYNHLINFSKVEGE